MIKYVEGGGGKITHSKSRVSGLLMPNQRRIPRVQREKQVYS